MGIDNYPNIFQQKMNDFFHGFEFIRAFIYDVLILTKRDWTDHMKRLNFILSKLEVKGLNVILKSLSLDKPKWNI